MDLGGAGLEQIRPWISTGFLGVITVLVAYFGRPIAQFIIEWKRLSLEEKAADRDGYGVLIDRLQQTVTRLSDEVDKVRGQLNECEKRHTAMEGEMKGLRAQILMQSASAAVALGQPSEMVREAAERVTKIVKEGQ